MVLGLIWVRVWGLGFRASVFCFGVYLEGRGT